MASPTILGKQPGAALHADAVLAFLAEIPGVLGCDLVVAQVAIGLIVPPSDLVPDLSHDFALHEVTVWTMKNVWCRRWLLR